MSGLGFVGQPVTAKRFNRLDIMLRYIKVGNHMVASHYVASTGNADSSNVSLPKRDYDLVYNKIIITNQTTNSKTANFHITSTI